MIVSPDGRASACYMLPADWESRGMDLDIGWVRAGDVSVDQRALDTARRLVTDKPRCRGCGCQWSCAGGCHVTHSPPGCSVQYNEFCHQTRIVTACQVLERLGQVSLVDQLLADSQAMRRLATHLVDTVELVP
jgi:radical SAM protein with 4Fe4S-binding SPASM domain